MATKHPIAPTPDAASTLRPISISISAAQRRRSGGSGPRPGRLFGLGLWALCVGPAAGLLGGCETTDPCALRTAACMDVVLIGNHDDGMGNPIAYRGLTVKACAPNPGSPATDPAAKCDPAAPCGTELASTPMPVTLTAVAPYSANLQGLVTFQFPDSFNDRVDTPPGTVVDAIDDTKAKITMLKQLRGTDPRTVRIIITQEGQTTPVWDSRCDEDLFSNDQWTMLKYYRVGKNEYRSVYAPISTAKTSAP